LLVRPWRRPERERESMCEDVWYAGYGSNLSRQRFLCYISGGTPRFGNKRHPGCSDATPPRESRILEVTHRLYFALPEGAAHTKNWGVGGVAFLDETTAEDTRTICRMWRIKRAQYEEVRRQEGLAWYDTSVDLGQADGIPIVAVSHAGRLDNILAPSIAYLKTMALGLKETAGLGDDEIAAYFLDKTGIAGRMRKDEILAILADLKEGQA
jgi:hypothetical protein